MDILRSAVATGVERTVNKLRSYLLAAFNRAMRAESDPSLAVSIGTGYNLEINPVASTVRVTKFEHARTNVLSDEQLIEYMTGADKQPFVTGAALKLALILGGQRPEQLIRIPPSAVDLVSKTITLQDLKGRRQTPRIHKLPLPDEAIPILQTLLEMNGNSPFLFTNTGKTQLTPSWLSMTVKTISHGVYQLRDIRRTGETGMAKMQISKDHRAQLQSHGLSGVQDKHYDMHDYMEQKRNALRCWNDHLNKLIDPYQRSTKYLSNK
jgi:integrase